MYNQLKNANTGKFADVKKLIDTSDIVAAINKNNSVNPQHLIEQNRKTVNEIYLNTVTQDVPLDSMQIIQLTNIALMMPYLGGDAVYSARVMLGLDPDDYGVSYRLAEPVKQNNIENGIRVYPNPANNEITIEFVNYDNLQNAELQIYDLLGSLIFSRKLTENVTHISVAELQSGLYFYNIVVNNNCIAKEKLVILK